MEIAQATFPVGQLIPAQAHIQRRVRTEKSPGIYLLEKLGSTGTDLISLPEADPQLLVSVSDGLAGPLSPQAGLVDLPNPGLLTF